MLVLIFALCLALFLSSKLILSSRLQDGISVVVSCVLHLVSPRYPNSTVLVPDVVVISCFPVLSFCPCFC